MKNLTNEKASRNTVGHLSKAKGSNARAEKFSQERTKELTKRAALKRWGKK